MMLTLTDITQKQLDVETELEMLYWNISKHKTWCGWSDHNMIWLPFQLHEDWPQPDLRTIYHKYCSSQLSYKFYFVWRNFILRLINDPSENQSKQMKPIQPGVRLLFWIEDSEKVTFVICLLHQVANKVTKISTKEIIYMISI